MMNVKIKYAASLAIIAILLIIAVCAGLFLGVQSPKAPVVAEDSSDTEVLATGTASTKTDVLADGQVSSDYYFQEGTVIDSADALKGIRNKDEGGTYYLPKETSINLDTMATSGTFSGILDGNGSTITINAVAGGSQGNVGGLFANLTGTVRNLNIVISTFSYGTSAANSYAGMVAGFASGQARVENVNIKITYSPTSLENNTYLHHTDALKNARISLGGVFGCSTSSVINHVTVDLQTEGDYGFSVYGQISSPGWFDKAYVQHHVAGFIGYVYEGTTSLENITLAGSSSAKIYVRTNAGQGWDANQYCYGHAGGIVGRMENGTLNIRGLIISMGVTIGKNIVAENMKAEQCAATVLGVYANGSRDLRDFYIVGTAQQDWVVGNQQYEYNGFIKFADGSDLRFDGNDNIAYYGLTTQEISSKNLVYSIQNGLVTVPVWDALALKDGETSSTVWVSIPKPQNTLGGELSLFNPAAAMMQQGSLGLNSGLVISEDTDGKYVSSKVYDKTNVATPVLVLKDGSGEQRGTIDNAYVEQDANHNIGKHLLQFSAENLASGGFVEYKYGGKTYIVGNNDGWVYTPGNVTINGEKKTFNYTNSYEVEITPLTIHIGFNAPGGIIYGDSAQTVKDKNPASILTVGNESGVAPDTIASYTLNGYTEKTAAGEVVKLSISDLVMSDGNTGNYVITYDECELTIAKFVFTGSLEKDKFYPTDITDGGQSVKFVVNETLPDGELAFTYSFATQETSEEWTDNMPSEPNRYYVKVSFDNANYQLDKTVYTFTVINGVVLQLTDKVVDGTYTVSYVNSLEKLQALLEQAVTYEAEEKEGTFVFSVTDGEISGPLNAGATYEITVNLVSDRYEAEAVKFNLTVNKQVIVNGENGHFNTLENDVYDGTEKAFAFVTEDQFDITYALTFNGEASADGKMIKAGTYSVTATSANDNYEIAGATTEYVINKATPTIDFSSKELSIAYGDSAVTGDVTPVIGGVYDEYSYNTGVFRQDGSAYEAGTVNAGEEVTVTTKDFAITANAENYNEPVITGKTFAVSRKNVTANTAPQNVTYGNELDKTAADFCPSFEGLFSTDAIQASFTTDYVAGTAAGSEVYAVLSFEFTSGNADNYIINNGEEVKVAITVDKRVLNGEVTAQNTSYNGKPYEGAYVNSGDIFGDDFVNCTYEYSLNGTDYIMYAPIDAGTYHVRVKSVDNPNYTMGTIANSVQFEITKAQAPVIEAVAKGGLIYNGEVYDVNSAVEFSVSGLFEGDESLAQGVNVISLSGDLLNAGNYKLAVSLGQLENYETAQEVIVDVVIDKAQVTVQLKDNTVVYGNELTGEEIYYGEVTGLAASDKFNVTAQNYEVQYTAGMNAGTEITVNIEYTLDNADNYVVNGGQPLQSTLTVTKRALSGTVSAQDKTYDGTAYNGASAVWDNLFGEDTVEVSFAYSTNGKNFTDQAPVNAGKYMVTANGVIANDNYEVKDFAQSATFTIAKAAAPKLQATPKQVSYTGNIINPSDSVEITVSGLIAGDEAVADSAVAVCEKTILNAGEYTVGVMLKGMLNYEDAESVVVTVNVGKGTRNIQATARMGYNYIQIDTVERDSVEYTLDGTTWNALPSDARIPYQVCPQVSLSVRYKETANYLQSEPLQVTANITYNVFEEYVGRNYKDVEVSFANANEIKQILSWESYATGEKSATYEQVVGTLRTKYDTLMTSAEQTVIAALQTGAGLSGYNKMMITVSTLSAGGLALAIGALAIKKRKGGSNK